MAHAQHLREGPQTISATPPETEEVEVVSPRLDSVDPGPGQPPAQQAGDPAAIYDLTAYLNDLHAPPNLTDINDIQPASSGTNADVGDDFPRT
jgi:hypothetical protein